MLDILKWGWDQLLALFAHRELSAGAAGLVLGIALTDFVARMLPPKMDAEFAVRLVRLTVFGASTCAAFALNATVLGFVIALIAGTAAPALQILLMRAIYARWPAMKPQALVDCPGDKPAPRSLLP